MRPFFAPRLILSLLLAACLTGVLPSDAHAWTEASVEGASVHLVLDDDLSATVEVTLRVHVRGGWLENLEIAGLDEGLELDEESIRFVSEEGRSYLVDVRSEGEGGVVQFDFRRRHSPRRGHYEVFFSYAADLSAAQSRVDDEERLAWTLPGWQSGLDGVEISVEGPDTLSFLDDDDAQAEVTIAREESEVSGRRTLVWRRAHLPRTMPWRVAFVLERHLFDSPEPQDATSAPQTQATLVMSDFSFDALPLAALLAALSVLLFENRVRRYRAIPRGLVPLSGTLRAAALALTGVAIFFVGTDTLSFTTDQQTTVVTTSLVVILFAFALDRTPAELLPSRLGSWRVLSEDEQLPISRRPWDSVFDLSRCAGVLTAGFTIVAASFYTGSFEWLMLLPWLTRAGARLPLSVYEKRKRLLKVARTIPSGAFGLALSVHEDTRGRPQDVRLRVVTTERAPGLLRFDIIVHETVSAVGVRPEAKVLVMAREETEAARRADECFGQGHRMPGGRLVWTPDLERLSDCVTLFGSAAAPEPPRKAAGRRPRNERTKASEAARLTS